MSGDVASPSRRAPPSAASALSSSQDGLPDPELRDAWLAEHVRLEAECTSYLLPPLMSEAVLRRP